MERLDRNVCASETAFEKRPEVLNTVRVECIKVVLDPWATAA